PQRRVILTPRLVEPALRPVELSELRLRPSERFGLADRGIDREAHRACRAGDVAQQLARIRDTRVRADARPERNHRVEGRERLLVAAELDERVADHAVPLRGGRREREGAAPEGEAPAEVVAGGARRDGATPR